MGYDAVAISASDIDNGGDFFDESLNDGFPWVSANLIDEQGNLVSKPYVIRTINSLKVAIIGLTETIRPSRKYSTIDYIDPLTTLLKKLPSESDIIILLSNFQGTVNLEIATQFSEIDIIVSSDKSLGKMAPKMINNTLITQTSSRGKYLGKIDIQWNHGNTWFNDRRLSVPELLKRKTSIESQLTSLANNKNNTSKKRISRLQRQQQRLDKEIATRKAEESERGNRPYNKHKLRFIPVHPTHSPESIESIVQNIDKSIREQTTTN